MLIKLLSTKLLFHTLKVPFHKSNIHNLLFFDLVVHLEERAFCSVQKVNITSLTSMSAKARRRMFMFGPVKFKPEMELSAIRERQSRRTPGPMFPAFEGGETVADGGEGGGRGQLKLAVRPVKSRAHLTNVLAKSFCIS